MKNGKNTLGPNFQVSKFSCKLKIAMHLASLFMIKVSTMVSELAMKGNLQATIKGFVLIQVCVNFMLLLKGEDRIAILY